MSQVNYNLMSKAELKQYFLKHRGNKVAFQAYLDRINQHPLTIIANSEDPDFDEKVQAAIRQKLEVARIRMNSKTSTPDKPTSCTRTISSTGLRRNTPRTIVLSKFSSISSLIMLAALLYEQLGDCVNLSDQISLDSFPESFVLAAVAVPSRFLLPIGA